jgi:hypothetical protein
VGEKEEGARGVLIVGTGGQCGEGVRPAMGLKGGSGLGFIGEVILTRSGKNKVWNGGGARWPSQRCLLQGGRGMVGALQWQPTITGREREVVGDGFKEGEVMGRWDGWLISIEGRHRR